MKPPKFSYSATAQRLMLPKREMEALRKLFDRDPMRPEVTKKITNGRYISRVGGKRVLWRVTSDERVEILSVVDGSYLSEAG